MLTRSGAKEGRFLSCSRDFIHPEVSVLQLLAVLMGGLALLLMADALVFTTGP